MNSCLVVLMILACGIYSCSAGLTIGQNNHPLGLFNTPQSLSDVNYGNNPVVSQAFPSLPAPAAAVPREHLLPAPGDLVNIRISDNIANNVLRFALNIGQQLSAAPSKSEVFSPLSVMSALALLLLGAKGNSYHELQTLFGLGFDSELQSHPERFHEQFGLLLSDLQKSDVNNISPQRGQDHWRYTEALQNIRNNRKTSSYQPNEHVIEVANGLFAQKGYSINPDYSEVISSVYHSELSQLDFQRKAAQSRSYINKWVDRSTHGKIPSIIDSEIERGTNVIMASALYFRALWENDFFASATKLDDFYPDGFDRQPVKVPMMATGGTFPFYNATEYGCHIIGLPYRGNLTTMYVIQPYQSTRAKLRQLQSILDAGKIEDMISRMVRSSALLVFPKMRLSRSLNMKNLLKNLGVREIFSNRQSDLSLIGNDPSTAFHPSADVHPSAAIHPSAAVHPSAAAYPSGVPIRLHGDDASSSSAPTESKTTPLDRFGEPAQIFVRGSFIDQTAESLQRLESDRAAPSIGPSDLFVEDIVHKVDFDVNEQGTEAAAATVTYLKKSGPEVLFRAESPFMLLIRHDPTKLILFYGIINEPPAAASSTGRGFGSVDF